jgi:hypothetical protein
MAMNEKLKLVKEAFDAEKGVTFGKPAVVTEQQGGVWVECPAEAWDGVPTLYEAVAGKDGGGYEFVRRA